MKKDSEEKGQKGKINPDATNKSQAIKSDSVAKGTVTIQASPTSGGAVQPIQSGNQSREGEQEDLRG